MENPPRKTEHIHDGQVSACMLCYVHVCNSSHLERGRLLAIWPPCTSAPSRVQQLKRFELISSCRGAFVHVVYIPGIYVFQDDKCKYLTNCGAIGFASETQCCGSGSNYWRLIWESRLFWELLCLVLLAGSSSYAHLLCSRHRNRQYIAVAVAAAAAHPPNNAFGSSKASRAECSPTTAVLQQQQRTNVT